jgi:hypothetical protein
MLYTLLGKALNEAFNKRSRPPNPCFSGPRNRLRIGTYYNAIMDPDRPQNEADLQQNDADLLPRCLMLSVQNGSS